MLHAIESFTAVCTHYKAHTGHHTLVITHWSSHTGHHSLSKKASCVLGLSFFGFFAMACLDDSCCCWCCLARRMLCRWYRLDANTGMAPLNSSWRGGRRTDSHLQYTSHVHNNNLLNVLYTNIDLKLQDKSHGPMHYKRGVAYIFKEHK